MMDSASILAKINASIVNQADIDRVIGVLKSGFLSKPDGGPAVIEFQNLMAKAHNMKYVFAVNSGTSALHCAMVALNLNNGDEVIVPALANIADASTVIQAGGKPVFADVDSADFNINPVSVEERITEKTRAIVLVHMYGQPGKIDEIRSIAKKHGLALIEDCAQATGARYKGQYVGSFGDISCFSLYQTKHLICGEGGIVATNNEEYAKLIGSIANNGIMKENLDAYDYDRIGFNYQLTDIQAALAIGQFHKLDANNIKRRSNVELFKDALKDVGIQFQKTEEHTENSYFYLSALLPDDFALQRNDFLKLVAKAGVPIKKLYPLSLPELTLFKGSMEDNCPIAKDLTKRIFNMYVNPGLDAPEIHFMAEAILKAFSSVNYV